MEWPSAQIDPALLLAMRGRVRAKIAADLEREASEAEELRGRALRALVPALAQARAQQLCGEVWLIGSYAWGAPHEKSDVDLVAEGCRDPDLLAAVVGQRLGVEVHVIRLERAPEALRARTIGEGRPL
jgi:predicted nucleotidyltransferase